MEPLDDSQERELAFLRAQRTARVNLPLPQRFLGALAVPLLLSLLAGGIAALARGPWATIGLGAAALGLLVAMPHVLMPERMLRATVRLTTPTAESIKRGNNNKSWPG